MIKIRVHTHISQQELDKKVGKIVTDDDYNVLLTRATTVLLANGEVLCIYLPGVLADVIDSTNAYDVLHPLRSMLTDNRGKASGSPRIRFTGDSRTRSMKVASTIIGSMDAMGPKKYCRQTSWTGQHAERFAVLYPLFRTISDEFAAAHPLAWMRQHEQAQATDPAWIIPGTCFSTITVNNTYPTGVHQDAGDLKEGFSTLAVLRYGEYSGGVTVFPQQRVGVDMKHGDLLLMDAHRWHGNTAIKPGNPFGKEFQIEHERISLVSYFRTKMTDCGSAEDEIEKMRAYADKAAANGGTVR